MGGEDSHRSKIRSKGPLFMSSSCTAWLAIQRQAIHGGTLLALLAPRLCIGARVRDATPSVFLVRELRSLPLLLRSVC
jgi:hypothetical protein